MEDYVWDTFEEDEALKFADDMLFYWDFWFDGLSAAEQEAALRHAFLAEEECVRSLALRKYVSARKGAYYRFITRERNGDI